MACLFDREQDMVVGVNMSLPSNMLITMKLLNGLPIDEDPEFDPTNPFENRDPRLKASIVTPGALMDASYHSAA